MAIPTQPPGLQVDLAKCSRATRQWVLALSDELEQVRAELAWCHEGLTRAHDQNRRSGELNPDIPAPDWHTVYESLKAAEQAGEEV
jgi:hypothetical protein